MISDKMINDIYLDEVLNLICPLILSPDVIGSKCEKYRKGKSMFLVEVMEYLLIELHDICTHCLNIPPSII